MNHQHNAASRPPISMTKRFDTLLIAAHSGPDTTKPVAVEITMAVRPR